MNEIFYDKLIKVVAFVRTNKIVVKICSLVLVGLLAVVISLASSGITLGFKVSYAGENIATVENASVFNEAKRLAVKNVDSLDADIALKQPEFSLTITVANRFTTPQRLAWTLIEKTDEIVKAATLKINGRSVVCVESDSLDAYLEAARTRYEKDGTISFSSFVDQVEVTYGYYLKSDIKSINVVKDVINSLKIKTVSTVITDSGIPFSSSTVKTDTELIGYKEVTTAGVDGVNRTTESVEYLNGNVTSRTVISSEVVAEPTNEVVTVGTAKSVASANQRKQANDAGFVFPLPKGYRVSAYYGDGRNHKGVDLAANKGTPIYAVKSGTVTYAGYDGDYGYCVIIDHGNGLKTRYAHASTLCVGKGDTVEQGDNIANVGATGYATGNHLHFEVLVNGSNVDPAPYIGLA